MWFKLFYTPNNYLICWTCNYILRTTICISDFIYFLFQTNIKSLRLKCICKKSINYCFFCRYECHTVNKVTNRDYLFIQSYLFYNFHVKNLNNCNKPFLTNNQQVLWIYFLYKLYSRYNNTLFRSYSNLFLTFYINLGNITIFACSVTKLISIIKYQSVKFTHTISFHQYLFNL